MIFLRHPRPEVQEGICYGQTDLVIGSEGEAQMPRRTLRTCERNAPMARALAFP